MKQLISLKLALTILHRKHLLRFGCRKPFYLKRCIKKLKHFRILNFGLTRALKIRSKKTANVKASQPPTAGKKLKSAPK